MGSPAGFLLRIFKATPLPGASRPVTYVVIRRPYSHFDDELRRIGDVTVIVDRRSGERREVKRPVAVERRRSERRRAKEDLGEMVIVSHES
jgi:hypothetical protein